ncbi:MAG: hypothetical protein RMJ98_08425 [Myxococcales bacterium]|nr:hypothetical protein [Polyangiaceae bacterium]MDW8249312.1 hypothetical protein [Myxococcales bacterium]
MPSCLGTGEELVEILPSAMSIHDSVRGPATVARDLVPLDPKVELLPSGAS